MMAPLRIALVGPLPPPSGGMANQTQQLARLLADDGMRVSLVQTNKPYARPVARVRGLRAFFRLAGYLYRLWKALGHADVVHLMANSGWSWHLWAAPAIIVARLRGVPVVLNYRGGEAREFFRRSWAVVRLTLLRSAAIVVPSGFLQEVFRTYGVRADVVQNAVDLGRFRPARARRGRIDAPVLLVARNLEPIYDVGTAIRALQRLRREFPRASLVVAGTGSEEAALKETAGELALQDAVRFVGRVDNSEIPALYAAADVMLNPSVVDNAPNSILEAWASGVPVVSTDVGGIRFLVDDGRDAILVPPRDPEALADAAARVLSDEHLRLALTEYGLRRAQGFAWPEVKVKLYSIYDSVRSEGSCTARAVSCGSQN